MIDQDEHIVLLDEIQLVSEFPQVLNSLLHYDNLDIYVTGSNSRFLSSDIVTEFRDRSREIHVLPLAWTEFLEAYQGDKGKAWEEYYTYGGLPQVVLASSRNEKADIPDELYRLVYIKDIVERNKIQRISPSLYQYWHPRRARLPILQSLLIPSAVSRRQR